MLHCTQLITKSFNNSHYERLPLEAFAAWPAVVDACYSQRLLLHKRLLLLQPIRFSLLHERRAPVKQAALQAWAHLVTCMAEGAGMAGPSSMQQQQQQQQQPEVLDAFAFARLVEPVVCDVMGCERHDLLVKQQQQQQQGQQPAASKAAAKRTRPDFHPAGLPVALKMLRLALSYGKGLAPDICRVVGNVIAQECSPAGAGDAGTLAAAPGQAGTTGAAATEAAALPSPAASALAAARAAAGHEWVLQASPALAHLLGSCFHQLACRTAANDLNPGLQLLPDADLVGSSLEPSAQVLCKNLDTVYDSWG